MLTDKRSLIFGAASLLATPSLALAAGVSSKKDYRAVGGQPTLLKGKPDKLVFEGGLVVPLDATAFGTLWEGPDRWITYGRASDSYRVRALSRAQTAADGTMQMMLITLAFAPERLEKIEGSGWRLKSRNMRDLVIGLVDLPGKPLIPTTDEFLTESAPEGEEDAEPQIHAVTGYLVLKEDVDLDYVRAHARLRRSGVDKTGG